MNYIARLFSYKRQQTNIQNQITPFFTQAPKCLPIALRTKSKCLYPDLCGLYDLSLTFFYFHLGLHLLLCSLFSTHSSHMVVILQYAKLCHSIWNVLSHSKFISYFSIILPPISFLFVVSINAPRIILCNSSRSFLAIIHLVFFLRFLI